jgi:hypothetical protein
LLVGGGFYWLVNGDRGEEMWYGRLLLGWSMPAGRMIRFGGRGLVGFRTATLGTDVASVVTSACAIAVVQCRRSLSGTSQATASLSSSSSMRRSRSFSTSAWSLAAGIGVTGATDALEHRLNGVSGNLALQLTW